jgi:quercetin dioxygenase-like cupin family protein
LLKRTNDAPGTEFEWGRIEWLVSRELGNSETMTVGRVMIRAGQTNFVHRHPNCDEVLHLLRGRLEHSVGDETFLMDAGDTISIPTGAWHNARSIGTEDALMLVCYSSADRQTETPDA